MYVEFRQSSDSSVQLLPMIIFKGELACFVLCFPGKRLKPNTDEAGERAEKWPRSFKSYSSDSSELFSFPSCQNKHHTHLISEFWAITFKISNHRVTINHTSLSHYFIHLETSDTLKHGAFNTWQPSAPSSRWVTANVGQPCSHRAHGAGRAHSGGLLQREGSFKHEAH